MFNFSICIYDRVNKISLDEFVGSGWVHHKRNSLVKNSFFSSKTGIWGWLFYILINLFINQKRVVIHFQLLFHLKKKRYLIILPFLIWIYLLLIWISFIKMHLKESRDWAAASFWKLTKDFLNKHSKIHQWMKIKVHDKRMKINKDVTDVF